MEVKFELKNFLTIAAVVGVLGTAVGGGFSFYSTWKDIPRQVQELTLAVQTLVSVAGKDSPQVVEFVGGGIISDDGPFRAGSAVRVAYTVRRNVGCPTDILVRFYNHESGTINNSYSYIVPAVPSPVSRVFSSFSIPVTIPEKLPAGKYSYFPELRPKNCGVYKEITPPMSESFRVINEGRNGE